MIVSDLHYEKEYHHGIDEYPAFEWLLKMLKRTKANELVALGDLGHAWTIEEWENLTDLATVHAIYGNHDDLAMLGSAKNADGSHVLTKDAEIRTIAGLRFGFINGIVSATHPIKEGVPRKTSEGFLLTGNRLVGIDVLCTHESPIVPEYQGRIHPTGGPVVVRQVIEKIKPKLAFSGHLAGPYTAGKIGETLSIRIDSSQQEKHYAILNPLDGVIQIYNDYSTERIIELGELLRH